MSNRAWVTLATNDSYGLGALVLAHSLRRVGSTYPAAVLITPAVTEPMRDRLRGVFADVVLVDVLDSRDAAHLALLQRPELGITFTKIHCWTLTQYEKCVFLDADTLVVQNCDELFDREELSAAPDVGWPDCFNSGVFVYKPSNETFDALVRFAQERGSFDGGDQGLLNSFFSDWARGDPTKRLPFIYNVTSAAFYSYLPALKQFGRDMKIIHFIGAGKPWLQTYNWETRSVSAPDHVRELLQLWWDLFVSQVHSHLDVTMENAPQDPPLDRANYYELQVDPDSQFSWHRPEAQAPPDSEHERYVEKCLAEFHDPWENYRGNVPPEIDECNHKLQQHTVGRVEVNKQTRDFAWEYITPHNHGTQKEEWYKNQQKIYDSSEHHHDTDLQSQPWYTHPNDTIENTPSQIHDSRQQYHLQQWQNYSHKPSENTLSECHSQDWHSHSQLPEHVSHHQYSNPNEQYQDNIQYNENCNHYHSQNSYPNEQNAEPTYSQSYHKSDNEINSQSDFGHRTEYFGHNHSPHIQRFDEGHNCRSQNVIIHQMNHDHTKHHEDKIIENIENIEIEEQTTQSLQITTINENKNDEKNDNEYKEEVRPRHPYDYFWLLHKVTIDPLGRKICTHELPPTPPPSPPPERSMTPDLDKCDEQSGVAGNFARVSPGIVGSQREVLDELTRRQGWEAGNIDYMGADSFANIWAKISQTLSQPRSSPPKQATPPPKEPSPPKQSAPSTEITATVTEAIEQIEQPKTTPGLAEIDAPVSTSVTTTTEAVSSTPECKILATTLESDSKVITEIAKEPVVSEVQPEASETKEESKIEPEAIQENVAVGIEMAVKTQHDVMASQAITESEVKSASVTETESSIKSLTKTDLVPYLGTKPEDVSTTKPEVATQDPPTAEKQEDAETKTSAPISLTSAIPLPDSVSKLPSVSQESKTKTPAPIPANSAIPLPDSISELPSVCQESETKTPPPIPATSAIPLPDSLPELSSVAQESVGGTQLEKTVSESTEIIPQSVAESKSLPSEAIAAITPVEAPVVSSADVPLSAPATEDPATVPAAIQVSVATDSSEIIEAPIKESLVLSPPLTDIPTPMETSSKEPETTQSPSITETSITKPPAATEASATTKSPATTEVSAITKSPATTEATTKTETQCLVKEKTLTTMEGSAKPEVVTTTEFPTNVSETETSAAVFEGQAAILTSAPTAVEKVPSTPDTSLEISKDSASDSPPLATTPAKEEALQTTAKSGAAAAGEGERATRRPVQRLQLASPAAAAPPTPDSEIEDAAALAQSIIAGELATPTVTAPTPPLPAPASPVSLAQIGVKPAAKEKTTTAAQIASSIPETKKKTEKPEPGTPPTPGTPGTPTDAPEVASASAPKEEPAKKKVVKKVKKEGASGAEMPVPPPRKKEKKPKDK